MWVCFPRKQGRDNIYDTAGALKNAQSSKLHPDSDETSASEVKPMFGMWL